METQAELRKRLLAERRGLTPEQVQSKGVAIQRRVLSLAEFQGARVIALYHPFWNEVMTDLIESESLRRGIQVGYPVVGQIALEGEKMEFVSPQKEVLNLEQIDCVFVPGVVFDETRHRIGLGRGCYDRSLASYQGVKIGLAYDFQVLPQIPHNPHDLVCDHVMTELRHLKT